MNNRRKQLMLASAREYCKCVVEGKTLKYNQLFENGNFTNTTSWYAAYGTFTISNNTGTLTCNGQNPNPRLQQNVDLIANHKYAIVSTMRCNNARNGICDIGGASGNGFVFTPNEWQLVVQIATTNANYDACMLQLTGAENGDILEYRNYMLFDLTALGLDSISSPSEFLSTDLGKYIVKGNYLETTSGAFLQATTPINFEGVNIWNEKYRGGCYDTTNGDYQPSSGDYEICSAEMMRVKPNTTYAVFCESDVTLANFVVFYDKNKNFIDYQYYVSNFYINIKTPVNAYYMNITFGSDYGNVYHNDICISENAWNENYEIGYIDGNGIFHSGEGIDRVCSKDLIKLENGTYITNKTVYVYVYDKNGNFIEEQDTWNANTTRKFASTTYIKITGTTNETTYNNDIAIFYYGYQKYCGTNALMEGFIFQKGDTYKSWGLDEISYNQSIPNDNQDFTNETTDTRQSLIISIYDYSVNKFVWGVEGVNTTGKHSWIFTSNESCTQARLMDSGSSDNVYFVYDLTFVATHKYFISMNIEQINPTVVGGLVIKNIILIDLTLLGLDNITSVADFNKTPLGRLIAKGYYLPYTTTNKTTKEQLVRTMKEIDLSTLTWTYISAMTSHVAELPSDIKYNQNVIAEKYKLYVGTGYPPLNCFRITSGTIVVKTGSSTQPSGKILMELSTPEFGGTSSYETISITASNLTEDVYEECYITLDREYIGCLEIAMEGILEGFTQTPYDSDFMDIPSDKYPQQRVSYVYYNGKTYIYIIDETKKSEGNSLYSYLLDNDIEIRNYVPTRMVSRRTISVESENGIDLDFAKE